MKGLILSLLLFILPQFLSAQEEIQIENPYESGKVVNGYKRGVWKYYDHSGEMVLQIHYDEAKVMYVKPATSLFYIQENDEWEFSKVDKPPMFIGSQNEIDDIISSNIRYPEDALKSIRSGKTIVSMIIDKSGAAGQYEVVRDFGMDAGEEVIRVLKMIPNLWIPATKGDRVVETKLYFSVIFESNSKIEDEPNLPVDPEIPSGGATLNVAPSVSYYKTFRIKSGNAMDLPTSKM